nr:MAG TPA: hypothetical protein [Caudoviricetes sp.]
MKSDMIIILILTSHLNLKVIKEMKFIDLG